MKKTKIENECEIEDLPPELKLFILSFLPIRVIEKVIENGKWIKIITEYQFDSLTPNRRITCLKEYQRPRCIKCRSQKVFYCCPYCKDLFCWSCNEICTDCDNLVCPNCCRYCNCGSAFCRGCDMSICSCQNWSGNHSNDWCIVS